MAWLASCLCFSRNISPVGGWMTARKIPFFSLCFPSFVVAYCILFKIFPIPQKATWKYFCQTLPAVWTRAEHEMLLCHQGGCCYETGFCIEFITFCAISRMVPTFFGVQTWHQETKLCFFWLIHGVEEAFKLINLNKYRWKRKTSLETLKIYLFLGHLQPPMDNNSNLLAIQILEFDDVTVKTIYFQLF